MSANHFTISCLYSVFTYLGTLKRSLRANASALGGRVGPESPVSPSWTRENRCIALAGIFQLSRVGLVTPLRDGMNLVAKEYVAAQSEHDPGVLVLSRFAGAAFQLSAALIVNPYDIQDMTKHMQLALNMSLEERRERWSDSYRIVRDFGVVGWCEDFLEALRSVHRSSSN